MQVANLTDATVKPKDMHHVEAMVWERSACATSVATAVAWGTMASEAPEGPKPDGTKGLHMSEVSYDHLRVSNNRGP